LRAEVTDKVNSRQQLQFGGVGGASWLRQEHVCSRNKASYFKKDLPSHHEIGTSQSNEACDNVKYPKEVGLDLCGNKEPFQSLKHRK
jgi:hypothetical protein